MITQNNPPGILYLLADIIPFLFPAATLASLQAFFNPCSMATHAWDISQQEDCQMGEKNSPVVWRHTEFNFHPAELDSEHHSV